MTATPDVLAEAERMITAGYAVIAVRPDKRPWGDLKTGEDWRRRFSVEEIRERLNGPRCVAIGFLGGEHNHHIVPLDFDKPEGESWWREQCNKAGIEPDDFPAVITPGKLNGAERHPGKHRYVTDTRGTLGNSQGELKSLGIDVRGNGHTMLPPSPHPDGGLYQWVERHSLDDFPDGIPPCPDFVYAAIEVKAPPTKEKESADRRAAMSNDERTRRYCYAALANEKHRLARTSKGERNTTLNNAALKLGHLAHLKAFAEDEARSALRAACVDNGLFGEPDGDREFQVTFDSGWAAGSSDPQQLPGSDTYAERNARRVGNGSDVQTQHFMLVRFKDVVLATTAPYLVHGIIPRDALVVIWGPPKCGKSFWTFDLLMHVALGWAYRGRRIKQGPVVYIACEGERGLNTRVAAFRQHHGLADEDPPFHLVTARLELVGDQGRLIADIRAQIGETTPVIVAIDTLNRSIAGSESSDEDMGGYIKAADAIRDAFKCAVVIIHHCGIDDKRPRGHTSLTGAADAQIAIKRGGDSNTAVVEYLKDGPDGAEGARIAFRLEPVEVGRDEDGEPVTSCVVIETEDRPAAEGARLSPNQQTMLTLLNAARGGLSVEIWNELARKEGIGKKRKADLYDNRTTLKARALVYEFEGRWYAKK